MPGKDQQPNRTWRSYATVIVLAVLAALGLAAVAASQPAKAPQEVAFSEFLTKLDEGKVEDVRITPTTNTIEGHFDKGRTFRTTYSPDYQLATRLEVEKVPFVIEDGTSTSTGWVIVLAGAAGVVILLLLLNRSRQAGAKSSSGAPGRMIDAGEVPVTFKDVAGVDEVVAELEEIKEFLADPERFRDLGATIPKGVLLFGPPGTGKTLLARAVAGEAGVPFFSISGSDFVEMYVGVGASRVRKLFEAAKAHAPCVVFIDEIDAVGRKRGSSAQGGQEERENTLNQLLVEMDGFAPTDNIIVMAASNRADILDPALTRPGRFDRQVIVDTPDRNGRLEILKVHGAGKPFAPEVDLAAIAGQTAGFSGADLSNLVNEAALLTARNGRKEITDHDLDEAIMRVIAGPQKSRLISDLEKRTIAAHEIGHAIVAHELPGSEPVHKVTIVGRGRALGLMVSLQEGDKLLRTRTELMCRMAVALGGRIAEEIMFDEITTGASNDLEKVNEIAQAMVLSYGMSDQFALRAFVHEQQLAVHSGELKGKIDAEIDAIVNEARLMAQEILLERRGSLERLTNVLIERETLERAQFESLMRGADLAPLEVEGEDEAEAGTEAEPAAEAGAAGGRGLEVVAGGRDAADGGTGDDPVRLTDAA